MELAIKAMMSLQLKTMVKLKQAKVLNRIFSTNNLAFFIKLTIFIK